MIDMIEYLVDIDKPYYVLTLESTIESKTLKICSCLNEDNKVRMSEKCFQVLISKLREELTIYNN